MANSHLERRRGRLAVLTLVVAALLPAPARLAVNQPVSRDEITIAGHNAEGNLSAGNLTLRDPVVTQGTTVIKAKETTATGVGEGNKNSRWDFKGAVHIEFEGAILDADAATATFADNRIKTITVRGAPALFSHVPKGSDQRNQGRANNIDYDAAGQLVHFSGKAWYSNGRNEATTDKLTYNLNDRTWSSSGGGGPDEEFRMTIRPDKPISLPRKPDRSTAE